MFMSVLSFLKISAGHGAPPMRPGFKKERQEEEEVAVSGCLASMFWFFWAKVIVCQVSYRLQLTKSRTYANPG